jgi:hypothetical protein
MAEMKDSKNIKNSKANKLFLTPLVIALQQEF